MTGWASFLEGARPDPGEGKTLDEALRGQGGRSWYDRDGEPAEPADLDERAANLLARGYAAGGTGRLASRLADVTAELQGVQEANEKARRTQARIARDHQAGKITAMDIARMDFAEPDEPRERQLERRADNLRRQLEDMSARVVPQHRETPDPVEEAGRRAHQAFAETTRAMLAGRPIPQASRRPFGGRGAAGGPDCPHCAALIASGQATRSECETFCEGTARGGEVTRDAYHVIGSYDAGEIVRGTEGAIMGVR